LSGILLPRIEKGKFSGFFVEVGEDSAEYLACVAVILFNQLLDCEIISADEIDTVPCCRMGNKVPKEFVPPCPTSAGHCAVPKFKFIGYFRKNTPKYEKLRIIKILKDADCRNISDPSEAVYENTRKYFGIRPYRISTMAE